MVRFIALASFVGVTACAVPVPGPAPVPGSDPVAMPVPVPNPMSAKQRFLSAAEANGCIVDVTTAPAILSAATLSEAELARIMTELQTEGAGRITDDQQGFQITTDACT